jgi:transposase
MVADVYDALLRAALEATGWPFTGVNPAQTHAFAQAPSYLAKTDRIDAPMWAKMGQRLEPCPNNLGFPKRLTPKPR